MIYYIFAITCFVLSTIDFIYYGFNNFSNSCCAIGLILIIIHINKPKKNKNEFREN